VTKDLFLETPFLFYNLLRSTDTRCARVMQVSSGHVNCQKM